MGLLREWVSFPRAKGGRRCCRCGQEIVRGEMYRRVKTMFEGVFTVMPEHLRCEFSVVWEKRGFSPLDLPVRVVAVDGAAAADVAEMLGVDTPGTRAGLHFGFGMEVRNRIRLLAPWWSDVQLDDGWRGVYLAGAKRLEA